MSTLNESYHHGDLRRALVEEGTRLLNEKGLTGLSLRELARRLAVSPMAPYRHYPNKDSLLAAIATEGFHELTAQLKAVDGKEDKGRSPLLQAGITYVQFALRQPALFRLMFMPQWRNTTYPTLEEAQTQAFTALLQYTAKAPGADQNKQSAYGCWSLVHGLALLHLDGLLKIPDNEQVEDWLAGIIAATVPR